MLIQRTEQLEHEGVNGCFVQAAQRDDLVLCCDVL